MRDVQVYFLNKIGRRENLEDSILSFDSEYFIVCDGVGGAAKGEVASRLACEKIGDYLMGLDGSLFSHKDINKAIREAEAAFDAVLKKHPESDGMGTTLTVLQLHDKGAAVAHAGDSRIYHIRDGKVLFQTKDHSYVNELVTAGVITPAQAVHHPQRNIITRAISGSRSATVADYEVLKDLQKNDYFILCTDGILEGIDADFITSRFRSDNDLKTIVKEIESRCEERASDNYSGYFIKLE